MFATKVPAEAKPVELTNVELDSISAGMPAAEFNYFMNVLLPAWAKEKASQPLRLPGL